MEKSIWKSTLLYLLITLGVPVTIYLSILQTLIISPSLQAHVLYLHRVTLTWFKDLDVPEQFGFQYNQVSPFRITTEDGVSLHAWHILPLGAYRRNLQSLIEARSQATTFTNTLNFRLLRDDPEARLVIYMHGTSRTLASGWRPDSYRALYSAAPDKIHILTFDYRGYGLSNGTPSEPGLIKDAVAVFTWASQIAKIPPERIVIFSQSLGSAVSIALVDYLHCSKAGASDLFYSFPGTFVVVHEAYT
jgi:abhydrolase domain-containing protein 12